MGMTLSKEMDFRVNRLVAMAFGALLLVAGPNLCGKDLEPLQNGAKFLFVVDTSSVMNRYDHGGRQTVFDLIFSGVSKQMQSGDTFGVWTFNEQVSAGAFSMQVWDPDQNLELATRAGVFLKNQHYQGKPHAEKAVETALALVKSIKDVNVFVITSGDSSLGTSDLEKNIKDLYQQKSLAARKKNLPVVLSFSAWKGEIAKADVTISGEPIKLPSELLAKAREKVKPRRPAATEVAEAPLPQVARVRPKPIIMIGEKPALKVQAPGETATAAAPASPQTSPPQAPATASLQPAGTAKELTTAKKLETASIQTQTAAKQAAVDASDLLPKPITVSAREPVVKPTEPGQESVATLAVSVPPKSGADTRWIMFAGCVFFASALVLGAWIFYRLRTSRETSFISRSMAQR
jgi:hypothetical protein